MDFPGRPRFRQMSPERAKVCMQQRGIKPTFKKVQVVYYLSRDGHLEHPHYMEVSHLVHQQLRLKGIKNVSRFSLEIFHLRRQICTMMFHRMNGTDVMERLTVLRGKGVPSLYSWSCKRYLTLNLPYFWFWWLLKKNRCLHCMKIYVYAVKETGFVEVMRQWIMLC